MGTQLFSIKDFRAGNTELFEWLKELKREELEGKAYKITKDRELAARAVSDTFEHLYGVREIFEDLPEIEKFLKDFIKTVAENLKFSQTQAKE